MSQRELTVGFLLPSAYNAASGIWRKVLLQVSELRKVGARALIFSFTGEGSDALTDHVHIPLKAGESKEMQLRALVEKMVQGGVEVAYLRRELWHPAYRTLMHRIATVAEINTLDSAEYRLTMGLPRRIYSAVTSLFWQSSPAGFVSVTHELAKALPAGKPRAIISNGIAEPFSAPLPAAAKPHLFFSGTGSYSWHGMDKFVALARAFPEWDFSIAGEDAAKLGTDVPRNVKCHGKLSSRAADELLATANIGVGTLALHRKNMDEACPLKVRSYLAYGLPSIIAYHDTDFSGNYDFICLISNTENNVVSEKEKIAKFVMANFQRRVGWEKVKFASETEKARQRYQFFQQVVAKRA